MQPNVSPYKAAAAARTAAAPPNTTPGPAVIRGIPPVLDEVDAAEAEVCEAVVPAPEPSELPPPEPPVLVVSTPAFGAVAAAEGPAVMVTGRLENSGPVIVVV